MYFLLKKSDFFLVLIFYMMMLGSCGGAETSSAIDQRGSVPRAENVSFGPSGLISYAGHFRLPPSKQQDINSILARPENIRQIGNLDDLIGIDSSRLKDEVVYLRGLSNDDDGGQGYLWVEEINHDNKKDAVDNVLVYQSIGKKAYFKRLHNGTINIKLSGAKGNGIADDTEAIQKVLDTRMNIVADAPSDVYLLGPSKKDRRIFYPYKTALIIYGGQTLNLNGSTLKLADACNCSVIINEALYKKGSTDKGLSIQGGTVDGNVDNQKITDIGDGDQFSPTIYMGNIHNASFKDITIKNYYGSGLYVAERNGQTVKNISLENIVVDYGKGPGIALNGEYFNGTNINIYNTEAFMEGSTPEHYWGAYPNAITLAVNNSNFGDIHYKNCSWGLKLQDGSKNVTFKKIVADGVLDGQAIKFQGKKTDEFYYYNDNIVVGEIISKNNNYNGLYIIYTKKIEIKSYVGINNGLAYRSKFSPRQFNAANFYDVYILWANVVIDRIESTHAMVGVIDSRNMFASGDNFRKFGKVIVKDLQGGYVASFKDSANSIEEILITTSSEHGHPIVYTYGGDVASPENRTTVGSLISNMRMSKGVEPFHVYRVGKGVFLNGNFIKMGDMQALNAINNRYMPAIHNQAK